MPACSRAQSMASTISRFGTPWFSRPKATSFSTVRANIWLSGFWNMRPTCWARFDVGLSLVDRPATVTSPVSSPW